MINTNNEPVPCADSECNNTFTKFRTTDKYCSFSCKKRNLNPVNAKKSVRIKKVSDKMKKKLSEYHKIASDFLNEPKNKACPVTGMPTTEVHHKKGRIGFADEYARTNNIPLLIDTRYFLAVSRKGHRRIEENPIWAKEHDYSFDRI